MGRRQSLARERCQQQIREPVSGEIQNRKPVPKHECTIEPNAKAAVGEKKKIVRALENI